MSQSVLVIGAGRSSSSLIRYLLQHSSDHNWQIHVGDQDLKMAQDKVDGHPNGHAFAFNALNREERLPLIEKMDLVISMLPARLHVEVAKDCLELGKHVITPSYVSKEMLALDEAAKEKDLLFLNEMGVDPGIDHMSAMKIIHHIQSIGGKLLRFESFTGGLIAPESDNNPWNYKFTWNPRNVVLAGQGGTAQFQQDHVLKYIPVHKVFQRVKPIEIAGHGEFEGYANRDSLSYKKVYGIENIPTIYRGTLRKKGFCAAWDVFVQLGMVDDNFVVENSAELTYRQFTNAFLTFDQEKSVEEKLQTALRLSDEVMSKLTWLGLFESTPIGLKDATPAQVLQKLLEGKLQLNEGDKDMIVMWHRFNYELEGKEKEIHSALVVEGEDPTYTAMSNTVGLPVGIAAKHLLTGKLKARGVQLPTDAVIYEPILEELKEYNITFKETAFDV